MSSDVHFQNRKLGISNGYPNLPMASDTQCLEKGVKYVSSIFHWTLIIYLYVIYKYNSILSHIVDYKYNNMSLFAKSVCPEIFDSMGPTSGYASATNT